MSLYAYRLIDPDATPALKNPLCTPGEFRAGMRKLAAAVSIITADSGGRRNGLTATAVMSLTAKPPRLVIAINKDASAYAVIVGSGSFCVNVLAAEQVDIARRFAGDVKGEERFALGHWGILETGSPVLEGAVTNFDCDLSETVDCGTHALLIGLVKRVLVNAQASPLLYADSQWRRLAEPAADNPTLQTAPTRKTG